MLKSWLALLAAGVLTGASPAGTSAPLVRTAGGTLSGLREGTVSAFLGIPYAQAPVGNLRWRAPQPGSPWQGVRPATQFAASCPQDAPASFGPYTPAFLIPPQRSEDCLYLNVWTPSAPGARRPVYVFIHGGAYQAGSGSVPVYDGQRLAARGAVVVTINYRVGVLGFFAHPDLAKESKIGTSGNYGVLDSIAALRWVKANIARFGGDPARVTIAGQSAGAGMVNDLLISPLATGLFQRAILESGPSLGLPMPDLATAQAVGSSGAKSAGKTIDELRRLSWEDLAKLKLTSAPFPIVDGTVLPADPEDRTTVPRAKVPVIIGFNRDETAAILLPKTVTAFVQEVHKRYGDLADRFLALYPHATDAEAQQSGLALARDRFKAALLLWAARNGDAQPVYAYFFERAYPGPGKPVWGAFHTAEVPFVFGTLGQDATDDDRALSINMQDRWIAFMRTGSPNVGGTISWPRSKGDPASVWRAGGDDTGPLLDRAKLDLFRAFVAKGGRIGLI